MVLALHLMLLVVVLILAYAWIGYPLVLAGIAQRRKSPPPTAQPDTDLPHVFVILAAYNEAAVIGDRIHNLLALDYPADKLTIHLGTDGCTDATADMARNAANGDPRIHVIPFRANRGKVAVLRDLVQRAAAPADALLVFSDANTLFAPNALRRLAHHFCDPAIGGVCGRLVFTRPKAPENPAEEGVYWRLETALKQWESQLDSCLGANGAIYALRAPCFWQAIPTDTIVDDFVIGMHVRETGYRMIYEPSAIATEQLPDIRDEWIRRVRIGAGDYQAVGLCRTALLPRFGAFAWCFWSHKVLRWLTPHLIVLSACLSIPLTVYQGLRSTLSPLALLAPATTTALTMFFLLAGLGRLLRHYGPHHAIVRLCNVCDHFLTMNTALFAGFIRFCSGSLSGAWSRTPRD